MTLSTTDSRFVYDGDASTTAFSYPRKVIEAAHLDVYLYDEDDDSYALQTLNTHYTFAGSGLSNGIYATATITFVTAPGTDKKVVIYRDPALTQESDFTAESNVLTLLNRHADRTEMKFQRMQDQLDRTIRLPDGDYATSWGNATAKADYASALLGFNSSGVPIPSNGTSTVAVSSAMTPVVQAASLLAGRDALGVPRPGRVTMVHTTSQVWVIYKPDGTVLSTTGTTTQGLQEAITYAHANGYPLYVEGGGVINAVADDPVSRITCTTAITIPAGWGHAYYFRGVGLWYRPGEASTTDFITFESSDFTIFDFQGELVYGGDGAAIRILPTLDNGESFIGWTTSILRVSAIAIVDHVTGLPESTHGMGVRITGAGNAIINCQFDIGEVNGGEKAFVVDNPTGGGYFRENIISLPSVHGSSSVAVEVGQSSNNLIYGNKWRINANPTTGSALVTYADNDLCDIEISGGDTGINLASGAANNIVICHRNQATTKYTGGVAANTMIYESPLRFFVHKNGTNQTAVVTATWTKVTWSTEVNDVGSAFASSTWTPGRIGCARITARVGWDTMVDQALLGIAIYKNGSLYLSSYEGSSATFGGGQQGPTISADVEIDAVTDTIDIYAYQATGGNRDINGGSGVTYFQGRFVA